MTGRENPMGSHRRRVSAAVACCLAAILAGRGAAAGACPGDCNGNGKVGVNEIVVLVDLALNGGSLDTCRAGDADADGKITVPDIIAAVRAALSGCPAATPTPSTSPGTPAPAATYQAALSGDQEVPPTGSTASGSATFSLSADGTVLSYQLTVSGLDVSQIVGAHIQVAVPGVEGPIVVPLAGSFTSPLQGNVSARDLVPDPADGVNTFADLIDRLRAGQTYVNVRSLAHAGGEIRGQIGVAGIFRATFSGTQETPPVSSAAGGAAVFLLSPDTGTLWYQLVVTGLTPAQSSAAAVQIGSPGTAGPTVFPLAAPAGSPVHGALTAADLTDDPADGITTFADFVTALYAGLAYVNIDTVAAPGGEIRGQIQDETPSTEFVAQASDFQCLLQWTKVRNFRITNRLGRLDETLGVAAAAGSASGLHYPVGTIVQLIPGEAMVKRGGEFDPANDNWEYFSLTTSSAGTTIARRGRQDVVNFAGGNCFACHSAARAYDFICESSHGCVPLPLTDQVVSALQGADPRCAH